MQVGRIHQIKSNFTKKYKNKSQVSDKGGSILGNLEVALQNRPNL